MRGRGHGLLAQELVGQELSQLQVEHAGGGAGQALMQLTRPAQALANEVEQADFPLTGRDFPQQVEPSIRTATPYCLRLAHGVEDLTGHGVGGRALRFDQGPVVAEERLGLPPMKKNA